MYNYDIFKQFFLKIKLNKWGNSLGIRIPKTLLNELELKENTELILKIVDNKIVLEKPNDKFDKLLSKINENNIHPVIDWGNPIGNEIW